MHCRRGVRATTQPRSGTRRSGNAIMTTITAPVQAGDERLARTSLLRRLLIRPEFGALAGAIVVWLLFASQARSVWLSWLGTSTYVETAALYGLSALAVALLMIGGEFDLSSGVMVGTTGMFCGLFAVALGPPHRSRVGALARHRGGHRPAQRRHGRALRPAQLHHHARHVLHAPRLQPLAHAAGHQADPGDRHRGRRRLRARPHAVRRRHVPHRHAPGSVWRSCGSSS